MARDPGAFFNISPLGVAVARLLLVLVVTEVIYGSIAVIDFVTYSGADPQTFDPGSITEGYLTYSAVVGIGYALVYFATMIVAGIWIYRAAFNARAASPGQDAVRPGWAVGWYFVPIMNLFKPYQEMKKVWSATFGDGQPRFFGWWWGAWIATNILAQISVRIYQTGANVDSIALSAAVDMLNVPVGIAAAILFRRVVREVTIGQHGWDAGAAAPVAKVFE